MGNQYVFFALAGNLEIGIDPYRPAFKYGRASEFNFEINRLIDRHLGFDNRIKNDSFFQRLPTIIESSIDRSNSLKIDLWGEFSLDRLTPDIFDALRDILDLNTITHIRIDVRSITEPIDPNFLIHTPNVYSFHLTTKTPVVIPSELFDHFSKLKGISFNK